MDDKKLKTPILVTKPYLPPMEEYLKYMERIWDKNWLTNNGPLVQELESKLKDYLGVKHFFFTSNGTIAMQIAIKALKLSGEIITTPFTYVATTNSIIWEGCKPVFVDIEAEGFGIDPAKIEAAITPQTQAIMAVHVYGNPNKVKEIDRIAKKHNLKVIYDAAHCFGTKLDGESVLNYGDVSTLSFHATKVFHTIEGGAIITNDDELAKEISLLRSFGHIGEEHYAPGINGKNSEFHAAMGLVILEHFKKIIESRKQVHRIYEYFLEKGRVRTLQVSQGVEFNYAYYPVIFENEEDLFKAKKALEENNIFPRRYFYPSLNTLSFVEYQPCPISENLATRALCLPFYGSLDLGIAQKIAEIVNNAIRKVETPRIKPTLSIGIPAHNEEGNIGYLIESVMSQNHMNFDLDQIIVALDGCSDKTKEVVVRMMTKYPMIVLIADDLRQGKAARLNQIYALNKSDLLLTLDGDVLLGEKSDIDEMVAVFNEDENVSVVGGNMVSVDKGDFVGRVLAAHQRLWDNLRISLNGGDHIANLFGQASLLSKEFSKSFVYPNGLTCDEEYLYVMAKNNKGFKFARNTQIKYLHATSFSELRSQATRYLTERNGLIPYFGERIVDLHNISTTRKIISIIECLIMDPFFTPLALMLDFWIRFFPKKDGLNQIGMWEVIKSTKSFIPESTN